MVYRKDIDGLRAVAILPVVLFHAGFDAAGGGFVGVDVFFVISGYLITALILKEKGEGSFSLLEFYERRARRILPALFFVMLCCLPFGWLWLLPSALHDLADSMIAVVLFVSNIHFYQEAGYFAPAANEQPLLHTWSLSVEEQFYLLFPLLIMAIWSRGRRILIGLIASIGILSLLVAQFGGHALAPSEVIAGKVAFTSVPEFGFYLLPTRAWELLLGSLAAFYLDGKGERRGDSEILSLVGLASIIYAVFAFDDRTPHPSFHTLLPVGGTVLIILFAAPGTLSSRLLSTPPLVGLGLISYSVYLWHQPLFAFLRIRGQDEPSSLASLLLILLSLGLGWLSWRYVERPFRDRGRFSRQQIFRYSALVAGVLGGFAMLGHSFDGFINRYAPEDRQLIAAANKKQMGRYVYGRYKEYRGRLFSDDGRLKALVIGDSFAQDFINMLAETGALDHVSLSIHEIASPCGNLYLKTDFSDQIPPKHLSKCLKGGWYQGAELEHRLHQADVIFLASAWTAWVAERLPKSLGNMRNAFDARVIVVGGKNFGKIDHEDYLNWTDQEKRSFRNAIASRQMDINIGMSKKYPDDTFVDLMEMACGGDRGCPLFTPDLSLISYDGSHLTKEGAVFLGKKLRMHPLIMDVLDLDRAHLAGRALFGQ